MGLDQYAYTREDHEKPDGAVPRFIWRKHAKLQEFMEALFETKTGDSSIELNCGELELSGEDVANLLELVQTGKLPECPGGFFYGHQFQDESATEYQEQDIEFCNWALAEIKLGNRVFFSCWW